MVRCTVLLLSVLLLGGCAPERLPAEDPGVSPNNGADNCVDDGANNGANNGDEICEEFLRPRANPVEFVGLTLTQTITADTFQALLDPLYGSAAQAGTFHTAYEVEPGLLLTTSAHPSNPDAVMVQLDMEVASLATTKMRTIFRAPASFAYGGVFRDAALAALASSNELYLADPESSEPFTIEHRIRSASGGNLDIRVRFANGVATLELQTQTPQTSLLPGEVNQPAFRGQAYESIAGTVWFTLTIDQFEFFSTRAYGITPGADQNFSDFELSPHKWLRLSVTPQLEDQVVDVGFEVVTLDNRRVAFAKAPASLVAGEQFRENVFRMHRNMMKRYRENPNDSGRFEVPFYYDDPEGGGVVQVIAQGASGVFRIAYSVESPVQFLGETDFVPYTGEIKVPDDLDTPAAQCSDHGSVDALEGEFLVTFGATDTVRNSGGLEDPLRGNIWGAVYRAEDVGGLGPKDGAEPVADFAFTDVDLTDTDNLVEYPLETVLPAGAYQLLGFIDVDGNADLDAPDPDKGDPVTLPIGAYSIACAKQPIHVEFAILLP